MIINKLKKWVLENIYKSRYRPGHYYSTIPDLNEIERSGELIFGHDSSIPCIDLREKNQTELLGNFKKYYKEFPYFDDNFKGRYHFNNVFFVPSDAFYLYAILRNFKPKHIIEVGSGYSSAVMLDTNELFLNGESEFTFIEPYPDRLRSLLSGADIEKISLIEGKVQNVDLGVFKKLQKNDLLFIDSSHVSKVGSDLNYLLFKVIPVLQPGVIIHFHDILYPFEYPIDWVRQGIHWNEAYLLKAFLMNNTDYHIVLFNHYIALYLKEELRNMPLLKSAGGSIYLVKK